MVRIVSFFVVVVPRMSWLAYREQNIPGRKQQQQKKNVVQFMVLFLWVYAGFGLMFTFRNLNFITLTYSMIYRLSSGRMCKKKGGISGYRNSYRGKQQTGAKVSLGEMC